MSSEVRPSVVDAAVLEDPITLRSLVDWYKDAVAAMAEGEYDLERQNEESNYVNEAWMIYVSKLASTLEVPVGWLSAAIYELASWEMRLAETAAAEGGAENFAASSD